jgi:hypothetical protein
VLFRSLNWNEGGLMAIGLIAADSNEDNNDSRLEIL